MKVMWLVFITIYLVNGVRMPSGLCKDHWQEHYSSDK